jgi:hypothetical protein
MNDAFLTSPITLCQTLPLSFESPNDIIHREYKCDGEVARSRAVTISTQQLKKINEEKGQEITREKCLRQSGCSVFHIGWFRLARRSTKQILMLAAKQNEHISIMFSVSVNHVRINST